MACEILAWLGLFFCALTSLPCGECALWCQEGDESKTKLPRASPADITQPQMYAQVQSAWSSLGKIRQLSADLGSMIFKSLSLGQLGLSIFTQELIDKPPLVDFPFLMSLEHTPPLHPACPSTGLLTASDLGSLSWVSSAPLHPLAASKSL